MATQEGKYTIIAKLSISNYLDSHFIHRSNWLRAAVLGANDGIISISSLAIGVAAASSSREPIMLATVAGLVAGALSMAAGGLLPLMVALLAPVPLMEYALYLVTIVALVILGAVSAKAGGSGIGKAVIRVVIWGTIAMGLSALVGYLFCVRV